MMPVSARAPARAGDVLIMLFIIVTPDLLLYIINLMDVWMIDMKRLRRICFQ
jgi:hypothetical protein